MLLGLSLSGIGGCESEEQRASLKVVGTYASLFGLITSPTDDMVFQKMMQEE